MASNLTATTFVNAVLKAKDRLMAFEKRRPDLGAVEAFDRYKNGVINPSQIAQERKSARRPVDIPVRKKSTQTILTTRTISSTPDGSQTAKVGLNWNTYGFAVGVNESVNEDNYLSAEDDLAGQIEDALRAMLLRLDSDAVDFLEAGKYTSLPTSSLVGAPVGGAYRSNTKDFFIQTPAVMRKLEMTGPYHVIANVETLAMLTEKQTFGTYNQQNLEKLLTGYEFAYSPNVDVDAGDFATLYTIPTNSLGMVTWTEYDCRRGIGSFDSGLKYYTMPISFTSLSGYTFTIEFGVVYVGKTVDASAILPGLERSYAEFWYPFFDVAYVKQYSSVSTESSIVKHQIIAN